MTYNVVFEIQVESDHPMSAAHRVNEMLQTPGTPWQYYVQEDSDEERTFSVDLAEDDNKAVQEVDDYKPLIYYPWQKQK